MEFLAIMFIGTLIAVLAVIISRPAHRFDGVSVPEDLSRADQGQRNAEIWQWEPMDDFEYLEALERHDRDPIHNPFPSDAPPRIQEF